VTVLALLGFFIGNNQELLHRYLREVTVYTAIFLALLVLVYVLVYRLRSQRRDC
jgi:membrane protein DedA with SNARE-associated domain